ncbi:hypothetical protein HDU89_005143 [Geranomyces variabilis]|nr:hypothetical protein HDU89_005143 [Geranomyces variabilis]
MTTASSPWLPPAGAAVESKLHIRTASSVMSGESSSLQMPSAATQAVHLVQPVTSLSISPNGDDAVLAAKKGLYIVNLEQLYEPPRVIHHMTNWEVSDVQWNPHRSRAYWIATTSNQKALVWNLETSATGQSDGSSKHIQYILGSHQRAVSDLNWSPFHPDLLATCSYDSYVHLWDLRTPTEKPGTSFCAWTAGATQVKFNRLNEYLLASSHDTDVKIWDIRKGSTPVTMITAHMTKIYGIDWSRNNEDEIITCSQDRLVKFWDINCPRNCQATIMTGSPVWRARFTPFGNGVVTMPQRKETNLLLWNVDNLTAPVYSFEGHTDVPREFVWRVRGGIDGGVVDDTSFELVTWSKDQHLRLWPIKPEIIRSVAQDIFRTDSPTPDYPEMRSPSRASSHRRAASEPLSALLLSSSSPDPRVNPIISPTHPPYLQSSSASSLLASDPADHTAEWVQSSRDMDSGENPHSPHTDDPDSSALPESVPWTLGREVADAMRAYPAVQFEKVNLIKRQCTITLQSGSTNADNPASAVLTATALVDAPPVQAAFLRLDVSFPQQYPHRAAPVFTFQKTGMVSMANRRCLAAKISQIATSCARRSVPCLDPCLKYLLFGEVPSPPSPSGALAARPGAPQLAATHAASIYAYTGVAGPHSTEPTLASSMDTVHQRPLIPPAPIPEFDSDLTTSSDSDASPATADSALLIGRKKLQDKRLLKEVIVGTESRNVPFPRLCGASFSPNGQLVYFFSSLPHPSTTRFTAYSLVTRNQQPVLQSQHFTTQPRTYSLYENYRAFVLTKFPKMPFLAANPPRDHHQLHHHLAPGASWGAPNVPADIGIVAPSSERANEAKGKFSYWLDSDESGEDSASAAVVPGPAGLLWAPPPSQPAAYEPRVPSSPFVTTSRPMSSPVIRTPSGSAPRAGLDSAVHSRTQSLMAFDPAALLSSSYCAPPTTPSSRGGSPDLEYHPPGHPGLHRSLTVAGGVGLTAPSPLPPATLSQTSPPPPPKTSPSFRFGVVRPIATSTGGPRSTTPTPLATSPTPTRRIIGPQASHHLPHRPGGGRRRATSIDMGSVSGGSDFGGSEVPSSFEDRNMGAYMERHANAGAGGVASLLPSFHFARDGEGLGSGAASLASSPMDSHSDLILPAPTAPPAPPPPREFGIVVHRKNIIELLPVSQTLAQAYTLSGDDPVKICMQNGAAAGVARRPDLVQIWTLAALLLTTRCETTTAEDGATSAQDNAAASALSKRQAARTAVIDPRSRRPRRRRVDALPPSAPALTLSTAKFSGWSNSEVVAPARWQWHPFGRKMVKSLFAHCRRQGDVQTLAMLVCVLSHPFAKAEPLTVAAADASTTGARAGGRLSARAMVVERQQLAQVTQTAAPSNPNREPSQSYFRQQISSTAAAGTAMVAGMITPPLSAAFSMMGVGVSNVIRTSPDSDTVAIQLTSLTKDSGGSTSVGSGRQRAAGWLRASTTSAAGSGSSNRRSFESLGRHFQHPSIESWTSGGTGTPPSSTTPGGGGGGGGTPVGSYAGDGTAVSDHVGGSPRPDDGLQRSNSATYAQAASGALTTPPLATQSRPHPARNLTTPSLAAAPPAPIATQARMPGMHRQRSQDAWIGTGHPHHGRNSQYLEPKQHRDSAPPSPRPRPATTAVTTAVITAAGAAPGWTLTAPLASVMHAQPSSAPQTPAARWTPPATTPTGMTAALTSPLSVNAATTSTSPAVLMLRLTEDEDAERPVHPQERRLTALLPSSLATDGLLDRGDAGQHAAWCRGYAEMLYTWGLAEQRAEVLKCVTEITPLAVAGATPSAMTAHVGVEFGTVCPGCGTHLTPQSHSTPLLPVHAAKPTKIPTPPWSYCWRCDRKRYGLSACVVCNLPARGLAAFCAVCAHGGCAGCLRRWFEEEEVCARGCGCECRKIAGGCLPGT